MLHLITPKKKLSHIRQHCGVYAVGLKQYSKTKFVAHYADLTLEAFNRMTNGIIHVMNIPRSLNLQKKSLSTYGSEWNSIETSALWLTTLTCYKPSKHVSAMF